MKKYSFLIALLVIMTITGCASDDSTDSYGYVMQGDDLGDFAYLRYDDTTATSTVSVSGGTSFTFSCGAASRCPSIVYRQSIDGTDYVGFGARSGNQEIMLYWQSNIIAAPAPGTVTAYVRNGNRLDTASGLSPDLIFTDNGDGTVNIDFNSALTIPATPNVLIDATTELNALVYSY